MKGNRRVGVFTLGFTLITLGILCLFKTIAGAVSFTFIMKLWPIILILLGFEVLVSYIMNKEDTYKIDIPSVIILIVMSFFAVGMAVMEQIIVNFEYLNLM